MVAGGPVVEICSVFDGGGDAQEGGFVKCRQGHLKDFLSLCNVR